MGINKLNILELQEGKKYRSSNCQTVQVRDGLYFVLTAGKNARLQMTKNWALATFSEQHDDLKQSDLAVGCILADNNNVLRGTVEALHANRVAIIDCGTLEVYNWWEIKKWHKIN